MIPKNKNLFIRQLCTILLGSIISVVSYAQHTTDFIFNYIAPERIRTAMQQNTKAVFVEIHRAYSQNKAELNLSSANITQEGIKSIQSLWAYSKFRCTATRVEKNVLKNVPGYSKEGWQVRDVPAFFVRGATNEDRYTELVIDFTPDGKIDDMSIVVDIHREYDLTTKDVRLEHIVRDFVEGFRTAYNKKDINLIDKVFSDQALIITGKILRTRGDDLKPVIGLTTQPKSDYMRNLRNVFDRNEYINIKFEDVSVMRHATKPNIYGVRLRQKWNSSSYNDEGWLFLIIQFKDENGSDPLIWVRTWQPSGLSKDDVFRLDHFNL